ncbi:hypothetical protein JX266_006056 [Neoarthrinium moseri]|nr:hypothetical protein JX266_006056 [Neoarthrinium moseri]
MHLFSCPPELIELIFSQIVLSRVMPRVMRLRLVSRQFKEGIDDAVRRLRLFSQLLDTPFSAQYFLRSRRPSPHNKLAYIDSYLVHQALRARSVTSPLGRIRHAAHALCEEVGDTSMEAVLACTGSLIGLAATAHSRELLQEPECECSQSDLEADLCVAAIYLGPKAYIERLIADGAQFCNEDRRRNVRSSIFGDSFHVATVRGSLDIIKLLLSCNSEYRETGTPLFVHQREILFSAADQDHRECLDFALGSGAFKIPEEETQRMSRGSVVILRSALSATPWPAAYERIAAMLGPRDEMFDPLLREPAVWLARKAGSGRSEMVRYFLEKGAKPNHVNSHRDTTDRRSYKYKPLLTAARKGHVDIVKLLLDAGADPNWYAPQDSALMGAVWHGTTAVVQLLLDHGADVNEGYPPPIVLAVFKERLDLFRLLQERGATLDTPETGGWAMAVARSHGLCSMRDLLIREGVARDMVLHRVGCRGEFQWWYKRLWPER